MQSDLMRRRNVSLWKKIDSSLLIATWTQLFLLLFALVSSSPVWSSLSSGNSWYSKWSWNGWCWTNDEDCSTHHVWNFVWSKCLRVDVWCNVTDLDLGSKFILSNIQSRATLWVRETCLIVGLRPLIIILSTASLSSETYNIALESEFFVLDGMWSMFIGMTLGLVGMVLCMFDLTAADRFPRGSPLGPSVLFGAEWNTSITKSQRVRAGIPSMRQAASREMISASVELCDTEVCFLHIQLIRTNVWLPKLLKTPPDVDLESSRSPAKSESWHSHGLHCCAVFPT